MKPHITESAPTETENKDKTIKPHMDKPTTEFEEDLIDLIGEEDTEDKKETPLKGQNRLSTSFMLAAAILWFILTGLFFEAHQALKTIFESNSFSAYLYLSAIVILISIIAVSTYRSIIDLKKLRDAEKTRKKILDKENFNNDELEELIRLLIVSCKKQKFEKIEKIVSEINDSMNASMLKEEILSMIEIKLLTPLDQKASEIVKNASLQTALTTAISPVPMFDMALILYKSLSLSRDIAEIYGHRPGITTTLTLIKKGTQNIIFSGVSELAVEYFSSVTESTIFSKISWSMGQGTANGILVARFGQSVIKVCRPFPRTIQNENLTKKIFKEIIKQFKIYSTAQKG